MNVGGSGEGGITPDSKSAVTPATPRSQPTGPSAPQQVPAGRAAVQEARRAADAADGAAPVALRPDLLLRFADDASMPARGDGKGVPVRAESKEPLADAPDHARAEAVRRLMPLLGGSEACANLLLDCVGADGSSMDLHGLFRTSPTLAALERDFAQGKLDHRRVIIGALHRSQTWQVMQWFAGQRGSPQGIVSLSVAGVARPPWSTMAALPGLRSISLPQWIGDDLRPLACIKHLEEIQLRLRNDEFIGRPVALRILAPLGPIVRAVGPNGEPVVGTGGCFARLAGRVARYDAEGAWVCEEALPGLVFQHTESDLWWPSPDNDALLTQEVVKYSTLAMTAGWSQPEIDALEEQVARQVHAARIRLNMKVDFTGQASGFADKVSCVDLAHYVYLCRRDERQSGPRDDDIDGKELGARRKVDSAASPPRSLALLGSEEGLASLDHKELGALRHSFAACRYRMDVLNALGVPLVGGKWGLYLADECRQLLPGQWRPCVLQIERGSTLSHTTYFYQQALSCHQGRTCYEIFLYDGNPTKAPLGLVVTDPAHLSSLGLVDWFGRSVEGDELAGYQAPLEDLVRIYRLPYGTPPDEYPLGRYLDAVHEHREMLRMALEQGDTEQVRRVFQHLPDVVRGQSPWSLYDALVEFAHEYAVQVAVERGHGAAAREYVRGLLGLVALPDDGISAAQAVVILRFCLENFHRPIASERVLDAQAVVVEEVLRARDDVFPAVRKLELLLRMDGGSPLFDAPLKPDDLPRLEMMSRVSRTIIQVPALSWDDKRRLLLSATFDTPGGRRKMHAMVSGILQAEGAGQNPEVLRLLDAIHDKAFAGGARGEFARDPQAHEARWAREFLERLGKTASNRLKGAHARDLARPRDDKAPAAASQHRRALDRSVMGGHTAKLVDTFASLRAASRDGAGLLQALLPAAGERSHLVIAIEHGRADALRAYLRELFALMPSPLSADDVVKVLDGCREALKDPMGTDEDVASACKAFVEEVVRCPALSATAKQRSITGPVEADIEIDAGIWDRFGRPGGVLTHPAINLNLIAHYARAIAEAPGLSGLEKLNLLRANFSQDGGAWLFYAMINGVLSSSLGPTHPDTMLLRRQLRALAQYAVRPEDIRQHLQHDDPALAGEAARFLERLRDGPDDRLKRTYLDDQPQQLPQQPQPGGSSLKRKRPPE